MLSLFSSIPTMDQIWFIMRVYLISSNIRNKKNKNIFLKRNNYFFKDYIFQVCLILLKAIKQDYFCIYMRYCYLKNLHNKNDKKTMYRFNISTSYAYSAKITLNHPVTATTFINGGFCHGGLTFTWMRWSLFHYCLTVITS